MRNEGRIRVPPDFWGARPRNFKWCSHAHAGSTLRKRAALPPALQQGLQGLVLLLDKVVQMARRLP